MSKSSGKRSYSMLQKKMNEVEKTKKSTNPVNRNASSNNSAKNEAAKEKEQRKTTRFAPEKKKEKKQEAVFDPNVPDRSYGDYFCSICDSHMNSDAMWEAHVTGKRHIKNVKKGDTDSKYDDLNEESHIKEEIRNVKEPVVGLQYIHEIRRREPGIPPLYNCFLCHASIATIPLVIEHVISLKHRMNFVKENSPEAFSIMDAVNLRKGQLEPLLLEECAKLEEDMGRGEVKVKQEKPKMVVTPYKRSHDKSEDDDNDEGHRRSSKSSRTGTKPIDFQPASSPWKSIDIPKTVPYQDDYGWRSQENDIDRTYPREYSPVNDREKSHFYRDAFSPDRDTSRRSFSRLSGEYARRSPDKFSRRSPEKFSRHSPDKFSRRSPEKFSRHSPDKFSRRSPDRFSRRSPDARRSPDEFLRQSPDRFARRSCSYTRSIYSLSPERDSAPSYSCAERPRNDYFQSSSKYSETRQGRSEKCLTTELPENHAYHSDDLYKNKQHDYEIKPNYEKTREVIENERPVSNSSIRTEIAEALINMSTETFFKMILLKLKGIQLNGITELHLLTDILAEVKTVLCAHLPSKLSIEKIAKNTSFGLKDSAPSPASDVSHLSKVQPVRLQNELNSGMQYSNSPPKAAINQINDLIFGARRASDLNSRSNLQTQSANYSNNPMSSTVQPNFSNIPPVAPASSNYRAGPSSYSATPNNNQLAASSNIPGPSSYSPASYNNQSAASSSIAGPASYNNQSAASSASYNNQSAASSASYNNQSAASSGIPGLTLTENESPQQQSRVNFPPPQSWAESYQRNQDYSAYRRF